MTAKEAVLTARQKIDRAACILRRVIGVPDYDIYLVTRLDGFTVDDVIALIDRGTCLYTTKAINAQNAGAIGLVVGDNVQASQPPGMGGDAPTVTIPVVSITQNDFSNIRMHIGEGVAVKIFANPRVLAGAGAEDRMLLYAPNPEEPGSSISHWDTSAHPNLLMEPNLSSDLPHTVDLTLPLLRDIGWAPNSGPAPGLRTPPQQRLQPHLTPRDVERP